MQVAGRTYGIGHLLVVVALILTIVFVAIGRIELMPLGIVLLLVELGLLIP